MDSACDFVNSYMLEIKNLSNGSQFIRKVSPEFLVIFQSNMI